MWFSETVSSKRYTAGWKNGEAKGGGIDAFWVLLTETKLLGKQHYESSRYGADPKTVSGDVSEDAGYTGMCNRATWFY